MPCDDSSSSLSLKLTEEGRFSSFEFAKITCGKEISAKTGYNAYCFGRTLEEILKLPYDVVCRELGLRQQEDQFILYLEWDALRSVIAQYMGVQDVSMDPERCQITSIAQDENGTEVAMVILPPREMPKILPCVLSENHPDTPCQDRCG